jgi:hypothetical protein
MIKKKCLKIWATVVTASHQLSLFLADELPYSHYVSIPSASRHTKATMCNVYMVILSRQAFALHTVLGELQTAGGSQVHLHNSSNLPTAHKHI